MIPTMRSGDSGTVTADGFSPISVTQMKNTRRDCDKIQLIMWQHRYYTPIVLSGLALPFVVGFLQAAGSAAWVV